MDCFFFLISLTKARSTLIHQDRKLVLWFKQYPGGRPQGNLPVELWPHAKTSTPRATTCKANCGRFVLFPSGNMCHRRHHPCHTSWWSGQRRKAHHRGNRRKQIWKDQIQPSKLHLNSCFFTRGLSFFLFFFLSFFLSLFLSFFLSFSVSFYSLTKNWAHTSKDTWLFLEPWLNEMKLSSVGFPQGWQLGVRHVRARINEVLSFHCGAPWRADADTSHQEICVTR